MYRPIFHTCTYCSHKLVHISQYNHPSGIWRQVTVKVYSLKQSKWSRNSTPQYQVSTSFPGQCTQRKILNYILLRIQIKQVNPFLICVKRSSCIIRSKLELLYLVNIETILALYLYNYTCN